MRRPIAFVGISLLLVFYNATESKAATASELGMILALISSGQSATWVEPAGDPGPKLINGLKDESFADIAQATFTFNAQGWMVFSAQMNGPLDGLSDPKPNDGVFTWAFSMDSNPATSNNSGLPFNTNPGTHIPPEFSCFMQWDGTKFSAFFEDRRPTEQGNPVVLYEVPFAVQGNVLAIAVPPDLAAMVVPLPGARWVFSTSFWNTGEEFQTTGAVHFADTTPWIAWPQ
jgi:hypothetical protein